jgi:hypothetical protein
MEKKNMFLVGCELNFKNIRFFNKNTPKAFASGADRINF